VWGWFSPGLASQASIWTQKYIKACKKARCRHKRNSPVNRQPNPYEQTLYTNNKAFYTTYLYPRHIMFLHFIHFCCHFCIKLIIIQRWCAFYRGLAVKGFMTKCELPRIQVSHSVYGSCICCNRRDIFPKMILISIQNIRITFKVFTWLHL
jgi:hypothetical protein